MNITLPNGKKLRNVPDGTSKLEIAQMAVKNGLATAEDFGGFVPEPWEQNPDAGINPLVGNAQALLSGATLGLADEAQAAIAAAYTAKDPQGREHMPGTSFLDRFRAARDQLRAEKQQFQDQEGAAAYVPELIGGVATGGVGLAKSAPTFGRLAATGAVEGGIAGAGYSEADALQDPGQLAGETLLGAGVGAAAGPAVVGLGRLAKRGINAAGDAIRGAMPNTRLPSPTAPATRPLGPSVAQEIAEETVDGMKPNIAAQYLERGGKLVSDPLYPVARQQGIPDGMQNAIKGMSRADRNKAKMMVDMVRRGKENDMVGMLRRPSEIVGDTIKDRIEYIGQKNKQFRQQLNTFAERRLAGKPVEVEGILRRFDDELQEAGIVFRETKSGPVLDFGGSSLSSKDNKPIREIVNYILKRTERGPLDAREVHKLKRKIDNNIPWDATNKMSSDGEALLKSLRHNLNEQLRDTFPGYREINEKVADTTDALKSIMKDTNIAVDINSDSAAKALGQEVRKLFTNYRKGVSLDQSIDKIETIARRYGSKSNENIKQQAVFLNGLRDMFGSEAKAGFEALTESGTRRGVEAAATGGKSEIVRAAVKGLGDTAAGVSDEARFKVLRQLLER